MVNRASKLSCRASIAVSLLFAAGCSGPALSSNSSRPVTILTGPSGGAYHPFGIALAAVYNAKIPGVVVSAHPSNETSGASLNTQALESGRADLAFARSDVAYRAFRDGTARDAVPYTHLRSMAVLYVNVVHILVSRKSGIRSLSDLKGRSMALGEEVGGSSLVRTVLDAQGLTLSDIRVVTGPGGRLARAREGLLDVVMFASGYPLATVSSVDEAGGLRLLSIEPEIAERMRARVPFFKPAVIPKGTYRGQDEDVRTLGIDVLLLCRDTVPESLVYDMTRSLFDALPTLARTQRSASFINVGRAPATPVPLHPGAARYYRERDLFR